MPKRMAQRLAAALACIQIALLAATEQAESSPPRETHVRYVIIGAGPGGLQLGHYLDSAGRDYVVFERHGGPGS